MKKLTKRDVRKMLENAFSPDIAIKVIGDNSKIIGMTAFTIKGAEYLLHHNILEKSYDEIEMEDLFWEVEGENWDEE